MTKTNIRNFSIIAHIDHGKSTLADRFIELCKKLKKEEMKNQMLDSMDIERERGITIKAQCLTLNYKFKDKNYILNLIDTPGHNDFSYEVLRSLEACEGVILLVDITKGIQAQTISNYERAKEKNLKIILALNKIDIPMDNLDIIKNNIKNTLNINECIEISAKTGEGIENLIENIIIKIPEPKGSIDNIFEAIIIDSWFDSYMGVICIIKIKNGSVKKNDKIVTVSKNKQYKIDKLGIFVPDKLFKENLINGEIGFITFGCKNIKDIDVGDTITPYPNKLKNDLIKIKKIQPKIFANLFTSDISKFDNFKKALDKLSLNDSSIEYSIQKSLLFGHGFRCGFLGLLHLEITKERLEREYDLKIIITPPSVIFKIIKKDNAIIYINNPSEIPKDNEIKEIQEPIVLVTILSQKEYIGKIIELCTDKKGLQKEIIFNNDKIIIKYDIPLNELISNFFDKLQTISNGLASMDYIFIEYRKANLTKMSILINNKTLDILDQIIYKNEAYKKGKELTEKLINIVPKQLFEIKIQAVINGKIIAKSNLKALRKNVLAKCYGGDISRKKKLIKKQKLGKKKLKNLNEMNLSKITLTKIIDMEIK